MENNALGAAAGSDLGFWLGKISGATAEDKAKLAGDIAKGNTVVSTGIASTVGVGALTAKQVAMWGLGAGANAGISYLADDTIDPANAAIAGWVNVISMGNGLAGTVGWNAAGGALGNWIDDKDPLSGAITNGVGAGFGYGVGKGISWGTNTGANWWKDGWDPKFNPTLQKYTDIKGELGLSKEMVPGKIPSSFGDLGGSVFSEITGQGIEKISSPSSNRDEK